MDAIFKALADPTRRRMLDLLMERDGRTLSDLEEAFPELSRFGVMKHLKVLEDASLIVTRKQGRFKHHHLNAAPIQELSERWVSKFAKPWARAMVDLKTLLETPSEETTMSHDNPARLVMQTFIRTTKDKLWDALTDPDMTEQFYFHARVESTFEPGAPLRYRTADGKVMLDGEILEIDKPRRLKATFVALWGGAPGDQEPSVVTYELETLGEIVKLTMIHENLAEPMREGVTEGWAVIFSGLKSLLETGKALPFPAHPA